MKQYFELFIICVFSSLLFVTCKSEPKETSEPAQIQQQFPKPVLNAKSAAYLYHFAYDCIDQEYPNKLGQILGNSSYLKEPSELHPAFYGCFDWHSSVHGHWTLLNIMKVLPELEHRDAVFKKLQKSITKENIEIELDYFDDRHNNNFERTYGWAWLLKVAETMERG